MAAPSAPVSFSKAVPRSKARSKAQEIIDDNRRQVEEQIILTGRREVVRTLLEAQRQIQKKLRTTRLDSEWTRRDLEQSMVLVNEALATASPRFKNLLEKNHDRARKLGCKNSAELLAYFDKGNEQLARPLSLKESAATRSMALDEHATSVDRYSRVMREAIREKLSAGIARGATFDEMTRELVGLGGPKGRRVSIRAVENEDGSVTRIETASLKKGLFIERAGWAERIVRTEAMKAYNAGANAEIEEEARVFPDMRRKLIETFDARTAPDSFVAHGQVRGIGEPFTDGKHVYVNPPGRPNDRAVVVPWRQQWAGKRGKGGSDAEGLLTAEELAILAKT